MFISISDSLLNIAAADAPQYDDDPMIVAHTHNSHKQHTIYRKIKNRTKITKGTFCCCSCCCCLNSMSSESERSGFLLLRNEIHGERAALLKDYRKGYARRGVSTRIRGRRGDGGGAGANNLAGCRQFDV